jgi:DNA-binding transcriptional regulator/RsmH inhibitor MraZ
MTVAAIPQSLLPLEVPMPSKEETSLSSKAMLCTISISAWSGYKFDREASAEIATIHGADKDSGRFNKRLVPRKELEEITKIIGRARRDHEFVTLPWSDNGYRVLPAAAYMDHLNTMRLRGAQFDAAVSRLAARFEVLVANQSRLGTLFKVEDYPGMRVEDGKLRFLVPAELRAKFSFESKVLPVPDVNDFRVSMGDQDRERIRRQIAESIQASLRVGSRELWQRLYKVVSHMSERMADYNNAQGGNRPRLYDSMITKIVEVVDVLPKLNIAGDTELEQMASEIRKSLVVDPQELRKSETMRSNAAKAAADIAQRMAAYMGIPATTEIP